MNKSSSNQKTVKHAAIYGASDILSKAVGFIMLPIYTRYLTPADYGVIELLVLSIYLISALLGMNMVQGVFRYFVLSESEKERKLIISNSFLLTTGMSLLGFFLLYTNAETVAIVMLGDAKNVELLMVFSILIVTESLGQQGLNFIRVQQKVYQFFTLSVCKLFLQLSLNIYFVVYLERAVAGVVYSSVISTAIIALISLIIILKYSGLSFESSIFKKLLVFSYPLWVAGALGYYVGMIDKYFIRDFLGLADVGLYALAAKFAMLVTFLVWEPFSKMWDSHRYEVYQTQDAALVFRKVFVGVILALFTVGLGVSIFSKSVIMIMADESFWSASNIIPLLVIAAILQSVTRFNHFGLMLREKTTIFTWVVFLRAILITILIVILIPRFGLAGAAMAMVLATLATMILIARESSKHYDMNLPWRYMFILTLFWSACVLLSYLLPNQLMMLILGGFGIFTFFVLGILFLPILQISEVKSIKAYLSLNIVNLYTKIRR